jgi:hypothetical protein
MNHVHLTTAPRHVRIASACGAAALILGIALAGASSPAHAETINVTANAMDVIANGGASCSLREAIINANNDDQSGSTDCAAGAGDDVINLPAGMYTLAIAGTDEDLSATGDLDVRANLTISGAGAATTIVDGGALDNVVDNVLDAVTLEIADVTIRNANGSGVRNSLTGTVNIHDVIVENNTVPSIGGGIFNSGNGTVNVTDAVVRVNTINGFVGGAIANNFNGTVTVTTSLVTGNTITTQGSAIYNNSGGLLEVTDTTVSANTFTATTGAGGIGNNSSGTTNLARSTISGNMATMTGMSAFNVAGGVNNNSIGTINIDNSTISGNSAASGATTSAGGIYNNSVGSTNIDNSTIFDNSGGQANSIRINFNGDVTLKNTIIATSAAGTNCSSNSVDGLFISLGHNIADDDTCGLTAGGDQPDTDPMLEALGNNGGLTPTHALPADSPAIDEGSADCPPPATDQRGQMRAVDGDGDNTATCDVGAFELVPGATPTPPATGVPSATPTVTPSPSATRTATPTATSSATTTATPTATVVPTVTATRTPQPGVVDHYRCYTVRTTKGAPKFEPISGVRIVDPFEERFVQIQRPRALCAPADKNGEGIADAATHLEQYRIKPAKMPRHLPRTSLRLDNQFGTVFLNTVRPEELLVPTAKDLDSPPPLPDPAQHAVDHYACYKVKLTPGTLPVPAGLSVTIADQFTTPANLYLVKKPTRLCAPADKNDEGVRHAEHLVCYTLRLVKKRCAAGAPVNPGGTCTREADCGGTQRVTELCTSQPRFTSVGGVHLENQFGSERVDVRKEAELCVPSERVN